MPSFWKQIAVSQIDDEHGNDKTAENVDYSGWSFNGLVFNHSIKLFYNGWFRGYVAYRLRSIIIVWLMQFIARESLIM